MGMMVNCRENLEKTVQRLAELRKLKNEVDPASGMSVMIRRGVLSDRNEDEGDRERRKYTEIETMHFMPEIIDLLIKGQEEHLRFWIKACEEERDALTKILQKVSK